MDSPTLAPPNPVIAAAAQQAQQPDQAPPLAPNGSMGSQTPQQAIQSMPAPQAPQVTPAHVSVAQRLLGGLFGHAPTTYAVDPQTGKQVATPGAPQAPGAFFKNVLAASMLGGASAAGQNPEGGFWGGVGNGARAVQANAKQQDLMKQQQAQKDFENKNAADKIEQEKIYSQAQVAMMHVQTASAQQNSDFQKQDHIDKHNEASMAYSKYLQDAGGVGAKIKMPDGTTTSTMTAPELMQAYTKDPNIRSAPDGFVRHFVDTTDASDVTYNGVQWVEANGDPVNMTDKTSIQAVDVPQNAIKTAIPTLGSVYNKVSGTNELDPNKTYQISPEQMTTAMTSNLQSQVELGKINVAKAQVAVDASRVALEGKALNNQITQENRAQMTGLADFYKTRIDSLDAQLRDPNSTMEPDARKAAQANIETATEEYKQAMFKIYPNLKPADFDKSGTVKPGSLPPKPNATVPPMRFDAGIAKNALNLAKTVPKEQALTQLASATNLSDTEKEYIKLQLNKTEAPQNPSSISNIVQNSAER